MKRLTPILIVILTFACAPIYVNYDYETGTDFTNYKTYNMFPEMQTGLSEFDTNRLLDAVDHLLQSRGFAISENPDFYVNISSVEFEVNRRNSVGVGVGGGGRNVGGGISVGIPVGNTSINRELTFDFIDARKDALFWQAISESGYNPNASPQKREDRIKAIVAKVLSKYPPEK